MPRGRFEVDLLGSMNAKSEVADRVMFESGFKLEVYPARTSLTWNIPNIYSISIPIRRQGLCNASYDIAIGRPCVLCRRLDVTLWSDEHPTSD